MIKKLAAAGAALAVVTLAACGGSGPQASPAACKTAMAAQLAASESGSQAAKNAPMPPQCAGLAPSVTQSIAYARARLKQIAERRIGEDDRQEERVHQCCKSCAAYD